MVLRSNCRTRLKAFEGDRVLDLALDPGEANEIEVPKTDGFKLVHLGESAQSTVAIPLLYWMEVTEPEVELGLEAERTAEHIKLEVFNNSDSPLDKVVLSVLNNGITISYKVVREMSARSSLVVTVPLSRDVRGSLVVRAVGIRGSLRKAVTKVV